MRDMVFVVVVVVVDVGDAVFGDFCFGFVNGLVMVFDTLLKGLCVINAKGCALSLVGASSRPLDGDKKCCPIYVIC